MPWARQDGTECGSDSPCRECTMRTAGSITKYWMLPIQMELTPRITVITIGKDCLPQLKSTVASVLEQASPPDEYILVDGASTDGSPNFIAEVIQRELSVHGLSEPD